MNMMEKNTIFVVMVAGESLSKNHENGRKIIRLENFHTYGKILHLVLFGNYNKGI